MGAEARFCKVGRRPEVAQIDQRPSTERTSGECATQASGYLDGQEPLCDLSSVSRSWSHCLENPWIRRAPSACSATTARLLPSAAGP